MVRVKKKSIQKSTGKRTVKKTSVNEKRKRCCICISDIKKREEASLDGCTHKYCKGCITEWAKTENSCPQCRIKFTKILLKKKEIPVEDRRQRPDDPENPDEPGDLVRSNRLPPRTTTLLRLLVITMMELDHTIDIVPLLPQSIAPHQVPTSVLYHPISREHTIIFFGYCRVWRNQLLERLIVSMQHAAIGITTEVDSKAHMLFNIINGFMSNAVACTVSDDYTHADRIELLSWISVARSVVFGHASANVPLDVDVISFQRPDHLSFDVNGIRSTHRQIVSLWSRLTGEVVEGPFDETYEDVDRLPVL